MKFYSLNQSLQYDLELKKKNVIVNTIISIMEARNTIMFMWCKETVHHVVYSRLRASIGLSLKSSVHTKCAQCF